MPRPRRHPPTHADGRPLKITFGEMREMGLRGVLVYCHCGHHVALDADRGQMSSGYPISSRALSARLADIAAVMFGPTSSAAIRRWL